MDTNVREENGFSIVSFTGDVDLESSPQARKALLDCVAGGNSILVDLSAVDYIDSSGVASLVECFQAARGSGNGFALVSVSEAALRVLKLARLDKIFTIYATVEEGLSDGG